MKFQTPILAFIASCTLVACGGGGTAATTPATTSTANTLVFVSTANAKAVGSVALEATGNPLAFMGTSGLLIAVGNNPTASLFTQPQPCTTGGTAVISGSVVNLTQLRAGDRLTATFNNCGIAAVLGRSVTLSGSTTSVVTSSTTTRASLVSSLDNLGVSFNGNTTQFTGDQNADFDGTNASSLVYALTGKSLTVKSTTAGGLRTNIWQDYAQTFVTTGNNTSYILATTVQSDNPNIATLGGKFVVTTLTPVVRNNTTGLLTSGSISVVGASSTRLIATVNVGGTVTIQVDANGDGFFESTVIGTTAELTSLL